MLTCAYFLQTLTIALLESAEGETEECSHIGISNPGPLTYESGALATALRGPASLITKEQECKSQTSLSYDVAAIQWIISCHEKSYDHTCNNSLARTRNVIDNVHVIDAFSHLKVIKSRFKGSYDKQNLTLVVISYEIYETRRRLVS